MPLIVTGKQQLRKDQEIPYTHMLYRRPDGSTVVMPTPEYTGSSLSRPLMNVGSDVMETYGNFHRDTMRESRRHKNLKLRNSPRGKNVPLNVR